MTRMPARPLLMLVVVAWLAAIAGGLRLLWAYSASPGDAATVQSDWPPDANLSRDTGRATLVMFVHPKCPCSRASAAELARLLARCTAKARVQVVATQPPTAPSDWRDTPLLAQLRAIPGVTVTMDPDGAITKRFGARTSGQTNLYDPNGRLLFAGGITPARGHEGDNAGSDAIVALINGSHATNTASKAEVYGCSLLGEQWTVKPEVIGK